jgi:cystathionine beta-lyase
LRPETDLVHGAEPEEHEFLALVPAVQRASTVVFRDASSFAARRERFYDGYSYGLYGTPTVRAFERRIARLEGGRRSLAVPSGLAAITLTALTLLAPGDHFLVPDSVYGPVRDVCDKLLAGLGIRTTYYPPLAGGGIAALITARTRLVWLESPGSLTMEVQDIPAIAAAATAAGARVAADNTWATPLGLRPFELGIDVSIQSASKLIGGHSDLLMGVVTVRDDALYRRLKDMARLLGLGVSADDCFLAMRGLGTLHVRLRQQARAALAIAEWLRARREVRRVLFPALPGDPGHALWRRDYQEASGVFSILLEPVPRAALDAMLDGLALFRLGASWGGIHSLVAPADPRQSRTATDWNEPGWLVRLSIGLEHEEDLVADLAQGLERLRQAA